MKEKSIQEENLQMFRRLQEGEPVMNINKLEDNYKNHMKLRKLIKKVGSNFNKQYMENDLPAINSRVTTTYDCLEREQHKPDKEENEQQFKQLRRPPRKRSD